MFGSVAGSIAASTHGYAPVESMEFPLFQAHDYMAHGVVKRSEPRLGESAVGALALCSWLRKEGIHNEISCARALGTVFTSYAQSMGNPDFGKMACGMPGTVKAYHAVIAARVEPIAMYAVSEQQACELAVFSAVASGGTPETMKASKVLATLLWMARHGATKEELEWRAHTFKYNTRIDEESLMLKLKGFSSMRSEVNGEYVGNVYIKVRDRLSTGAKITLEGALISFFRTTGFESCIRKAITLGGAREAMTAMAGALAAAYYGEVPEHITEGCLPVLKRDAVSAMASFEQMCERNTARRTERPAPLHPDAFEVIRTRGRQSVYIVDPSRKALVKRLNKQFGEDVSIITPQEKDGMLESLHGPARQGTYLAGPEPEVEVLYFQDGDFRTPADFISEDAAPMGERHRAQSIFWIISDRVRLARKELQERCGYFGRGSIRFARAIYPVIGENIIEVREGDMSLGSLFIDQTTGLLARTPGVFPEGAQTGSIDTAEIVRDLCLSHANISRAIRDVFSSNDHELLDDLRL